MRSFQVLLFVAALLLWFPVVSSAGVCDDSGGVCLVAGQPVRNVVRVATVRQPVRTVVKRVVAVQPVRSVVKAVIARQPVRTVVRGSIVRQPVLMIGRAILRPFRRCRCAN
jgi:hypothetical protein